ncbi:hypothetical protein [Solirhodobacter olei]|uniref:hypothetical protein n=1 Tax=Solirhodobacter olei TaxID=2493082 RepID=UPI000FD91E89|nr:hypothetical protein [Solirhodobacter olei]
MKIGVYSAKAAAISGTSIWETPTGRIVTCTVATDAPDSIAWDDKVIHGPVKRMIRCVPAPSRVHSRSEKDLRPAPRYRGLMSRFFH